METWQVTLLAAVVGGATGLVGALGATLIAQRGQRRRDQDEDRRRLRDAKRERERKALARVLMVSMAIRRAMYATLAGSQGETLEQKTQRVFGPLREAFAGLEEAEADLLLETDAKPVLDEFQKVDSGWTSYQIAVGRGYVDKEETAQKMVMEAVAAVEMMARERLTQLERPI